MCDSKCPTEASRDWVRLRARRRRTDCSAKQVTRRVCSSRTAPARASARIGHRRRCGQNADQDRLGARGAAVGHNGLRPFSDPSTELRPRMSASTPLTTTDTAANRGWRSRALFAAAVGYGLDGFDLLILSFALSGIIASFGLSEVEAGSLSTITLLGAVLGGIVFGALADRHGRVKVLTWTVLIFAVFTGLSAIAQG